MALALFDLDNTLLAGDSDHLWGRFLVEQKRVDSVHFEAENDKFFQDYAAGRLDIQAYLAFQLGILAQYDLESLRLWRETFIEDKILPIITKQSRDLVRWHRQRGDTLVIITATNRFVTAPIADVLGVDQLLATEVEEVDGRFTGRFTGIPCFQEGKVLRLIQWVRETNQTLEGCWFYSDSRNDLPLLTQVAYPVAVDPDQTLRQIAQEREWPIISLRPTGGA